MRWVPRSNPQNRFGPHKPGGGLLWRLAVGLMLGSAALRSGWSADAATRDAESLLRRGKDLANVSGGKVWLCREERTLRSCLAALDEGKRELVQLQKSLDQTIQQNFLTWEANQPLLATLKSALSKTPTDSPERKKIEQQMQRLESQLIAPERLAGQADVRKRLIQLINSRGALALKLLTIRRALARLDEEYRRLDADAEVHAALRKLGEGHRLGPLESYRAVQNRLGEYERLVFTPWLPVYLQSDRVRVGAILNETTPVIFTWRPESGPTVLPASLATAAGLALPPPETAVPLPVVAGRTLPARRATAATLRLGQVVLRDVPVHILGPEGEDLGALIGRDAFTEHAVRLELERLRLVIGEPK